MNPKPNKYHAKGVWRDDVYYHSQAEADYEDVLYLLERCCEIYCYTHHPDPVVLAGTVKYTPDFLVHKNDGAEYYVEVKGMVLEPFKIKFNLYKNEADKHLPLFTVKQNRGSRTSFSIMDEYCINPGNVEMA